MLRKLRATTTASSNSPQGQYTTKTTAASLALPRILHSEQFSFQFRNFEYEQRRSKNSDQSTFGQLICTGTSRGLRLFEVC